MQINNLHISEATVRIEGGRVYAEAELTPEIEAQLSKKWEPWKPEGSAAFFVIGRKNEVWKTTEWAVPHWKDCIDVGNCFPTREIAELTIKVEQLNRYLSQACVAYGGALRGHSPDFDLDGYTAAFESELRELHEAQTKLTDAWRAFYKQERTCQ